MKLLTCSCTFNKRHFQETAELGSRQILVGILKMPVPLRKKKTKKSKNTYLDLVENRLAVFLCVT